MELVYKDGIKYQLEKFALESEFEEIVLSQYEHIFGSRAILFGKHKISTAVGKGTIPDAFVVSPDKKKWYVLEIELSVHSGYSYVATQILKFKGAIDADRKKLFNFFDREIENDFSKKAKWQSKSGLQLDIHRELYNIIEKEPEILIIIDEENKELNEAKTKIGFNAEVLIFKCFSRNNSIRTDLIFMFKEIDFTVISKSNKIQSLPKITQTQSSNNKLGIAIIPQTTNSFISQTAGRRVLKPSPNCRDWAKEIPELAHLDNLTSWKDICLYLRIEVGSDSARRVLQKWVKSHKPTWKQVPE